MSNHRTDQKNNRLVGKERVFVNGTDQKCQLCGQVKTGFRKDKSKHFLFKFKDHEGLFCSLKCLRTSLGLPKDNTRYED